jgi:hypothetical protein
MVTADGGVGSALPRKSAGPVRASAPATPVGFPVVGAAGAGLVRGGLPSGGMVTPEVKAPGLRLGTASVELGGTGSGELRAPLSGLPLSTVGFEAALGPVGLFDEAPPMAGLPVIGGLVSVAGAEASGERSPAGPAAGVPPELVGAAGAVGGSVVPLTPDPSPPEECGSRLVVAGASGVLVRLGFRGVASLPVAGPRGASAVLWSAAAGIVGPRSADAGVLRGATGGPAGKAFSAPNGSAVDAPSRGRLPDGAALSAGVRMAAASAGVRIAAAANGLPDGGVVSRPTGDGPDPMAGPSILSGAASTALGGIVPWTG